MILKPNNFKIIFLSLKLDFMIDFNEMTLTYGWELEFIDQRRSFLAPLLPLTASFSRREITLINSNGLAVDSGLGAAHDWGGEINTAPLQSLAGAKNNAKQIFKVLCENGAKSNYRCNTQFHIGFLEWEFWEDDKKLELLKILQKFFFQNAEEILMLTMGDTNFVKQHNYPSSFWFHHQELPLSERKHNALMQAKTLKDFQNAFFITEKGNYHFANFQRQYVNVHQFFKTGSLEFRNFYNVKENRHIDNIANLSFSLFEAAICTGSLDGILKSYCREDFPFRDQFDLALEQEFMATRVKKPTPKNKKI